MANAKTGDTVTVNYTGKLADGTVFSSNNGREPMKFVIGDGSVLPGFEQAVVGMAAGDSRSTTVPPDQAYGPHNPDLVLTVDRDRVPTNIELEVGQQLQMSAGDEQEIRVTVTALSEASVTLDANHVLAGKDLTFDIELISIL